MRGQCSEVWERIFHASGVLPVVVASVERVRDSRWEMDVSRHDHYELLYMKKGQALFEISGRKVRVEPNELLMMQPFQGHRFWVQEDSRCELYVLRFSLQDRAEGDVLDETLSGIMPYFAHTDKPFIKLKLAAKGNIAQTLKRIYLTNQSMPDDRAVIWLLFMELFLFIQRSMEEKGYISKCINAAEAAEDGAEYIRKHYMLALTLKDVASSVYLSQSYFTRIFKEHYHVSPIRYLFTVRIDEAKRLLRESNMRVGDIASAVGFGTHQRFNEAFRRMVGMSPSAYRYAVREQTLNMK